MTVTAAGWGAAAVPDVTTTTAISYGLAGPIVSTIGIVPNLRVGALEVRNVEVRIEDAGGFSDAIGRCRADRDRSFAEISRAARSRGGADGAPRGSGCGRAAVCARQSGLLIGVDRDRLRVLHVMRGGPAAAGGWKAGDTICSIDGAAIPPDYATNPIASWSAGKPGRTVALGSCDGARRELTLRSFY